MPSVQRVEGLVDRIEILLGDLHAQAAAEGRLRVRDGGDVCDIDQGSPGAWEETLGQQQGQLLHGAAETVGSSPGGHDSVVALHPEHQNFIVVQAILGAVGAEAEGPGGLQL